MNISRRTDPVSRARRFRCHRFCAGLMPTILTVIRAPDAVLEIVFSNQYCIPPGGDRPAAIVRMDGVQPADTPACGIGQPREYLPLWTSPGPLAGAARNKNKLRYAGRE